ncbi:MAG: spermidine synthase [Myxococcota bacterium]|nr:spermidine synthase [Myxococcota bacterium]
MIASSTLGRIDRAWVPGLLFVSGATSLVYQLVWSKHLANLLGNSGQAHAIVLATFMGGLALGAYVFGRTADRVKSPLFLYGALELGIALYALAFDPVLQLLELAFLAVAPGLGEGARLAAKLGLASVSLVIPTMLMGGTLPALVRHFAHTLGSVRRELSRLYAINSLGAALGVFVAGVFLVPRAGLKGSAAVAILLNLAVAGAAMIAAKRKPRAEVSGEDADGGPEAIYPAIAVRAALFGVAVSGFTSMLYEVLWIRLLAIVMGGSTYAFTLILTAFILGIGLGSFWLMRRKESQDALWLFGRLQIALVVAVAIALPLYVRLPHLFYVAQYGLNRSPMTWPWYQGVVFFFCCLVLLIPTFFMGAAFPAAARVATSKVAELGRQLGGVYLWNTLGTILGAAAGGLWLMPALGMEGSFALGLLCNLIAGGWALSVAPRAGESRARAVAPMALGLIAVVALAGTWGWSGYVANGAMFRSRGAPYASFEQQRKVVEADQVLFHDDDTFATVLVAAHEGGHHKFMKINGKVDASNGADIDTQILAGHFGVLFHPREVKNVLLIGAGAAVTAGSLLSHPIERLDLVEISPAVIEGARFFGEDNHHALDDPRTHVHIEDAKTFMALSKMKYDLVVSVPSNPWVAGVSGLFTQDFFRHVSKHMTDDGILVQWIHTYDSSEPLVRLVLRTMRDTFPDSTTWLGPHDLAMVASKQPLAFDFGVIAQRMQREQAAQDLARCEVRDLFTLLAKQVHSPARQKEFAGEGPLNTDDRNSLEYDSARAFFLRADYVPVKDSRRSPEADPDLLIHRYFAQRAPSAREMGNLFRQLSKYHAVNDPLVRSVAERWRQLDPTGEDSAFALGRLALAQKDLNLAESLLAPLARNAEAAPEVLTAYLQVTTERVWAERSIFHSVDLALAREVTGRALRFRADPKVASALEDYCRAVSQEDCPAVAPVAPVAGSSGP